MVHLIGFFYKAMEYERLVKRYITPFFFFHILAFVVSTKVIFLAAIN